MDILRIAARLANVPDFISDPDQKEIHNWLSKNWNDQNGMNPFEYDPGAKLLRAAGFSEIAIEQYFDDVQPF